MPPGLVSLIEEGAPAQARRSIEARIRVLAQSEVWRRSQQATGSILTAKLLHGSDFPGRLQSCYASCGDSKVTILRRPLTRASSSKRRWTFFMRCYLRFDGPPTSLLPAFCSSYAPYSCLGPKSFAERPPMQASKILMTVQLNELLTILVVSHSSWQTAERRQPATCITRVLWWVTSCA